MEFNIASEYFWAVSACTSLGWALSGIIRLRRDKVSRIVRLSVLFSISIISFTVLWILLQKELFSFFINIKEVVFFALVFGIALRFIPFWIRTGLILLLGVLLLWISIAFSHTLRSDYQSIFGSAVFLRENTLELKVRYLNTPNKGNPREEGFFLSRDSGDIAIELYVYYPSPLLFQKGKIYYVLNVSPYDSENMIKYFPESYASSKIAFSWLASARLINMQIETIKIPTNLLRLYLLVFDQNGRPIIKTEY